MKWHLDDDVLYVSMNRAPLNEIGLDTLAFLEETFADNIIEQARVVIIHSTNPKGFGAGADLRALHEGLTQVQDIEVKKQTLASVVDRIHTVFQKIDQLPIPVIVVTHGICFGGGFELALTGDIVVAEKSSRFCFPELRLGIIPGFGGIPRLRREISNAKIRDLLLTGRSVQPSFLDNWITQVVPDQKGLLIAERISKQIKKYEPKVIDQAKTFIKTDVSDEIEKEKILFLDMITQPHVQVALEKFTQDTSHQPYLA